MPYDEDQIWTPDPEPEQDWADWQPPAQQQATPAAQDGGWTDYQQTAAPVAADDWQDWKPPPPAAADDGWQDWTPPATEPKLPEAESSWGSFARSAINAIPSTLAGLSGGAIAAGIGSTIGRVVGGVGGSALAPGIGTVGGWIGGGLAGGALGEYVYSEGKKMLGWDDSIQAAVNAKAHPIATAAGEVTPLALGLSPGRGLQAGARLLSGGIGGGIEAGSQIVQGEFSPERLAANVAAGVALPGNKAWLTRLEQQGAGVAGRLGFTPPVETAGRKASEWTGPPADIPEAPPPAQGEFPGLKPFEEDVAGGRQMEMPLEPATRPPEPTGQGKIPLGPEPVIDENGQYRFSAAGGEEGAPRYDYGVPMPEAPVRPGAATEHGTPGPEAAAGTSEAQAPPPKTEAHGPEDWGKKTAPTEGAAGVNVGEVDPTLSHAINPEAPIKAQQAGPMQDLQPRLDAILGGSQAEAPAKLRAIADEFTKMGQPGNAKQLEAAARAVEADHATRPPAPRAAAAEQTADVLRGPEPAVPLKEQGVPPTEPTMPPKAAEAVARSKAAESQGPLTRAGAKERGEAKKQFDYAVKTARQLRLTHGIQPKDPAIIEALAKQDAARDAKAALRTEKIQAEVQDKRPANVAGDFHVEKNPAGEGHVIMRGDEVLPGSYPTKGPAFIAMNRMAKEAGGPTQQQQQQQQTPQPSRPSVRTHDGSVFTGDTVGQAAEFARAAGYREHQIIRPKEAAAPPAEPPAGGPPKVPPASAAPPAGAPSSAPGSVEAAREHVLSRLAPKESVFDRLPRTIGEGKDLLHKLYTYAKNEFHPLERKAGQDPNLKPEDNFATLARLTNGTRGRVDWTLNNNTYDIRTHKANGDGLRKVLEPVREDMTNFTAYAMAKRAIEKHGQGVETGIDPAKARQLVAADTAKFEKPLRELHAYNDRILDNLQRSGVLSMEQVAQIRKMNKEYVPFYRLVDPESDLGRQVGVGLQVNDPVHKMKGSELEVLNPIDSIIKNTYVFTAMAERNMAMQALERWALKNPGLLERDRSTRPTTVKTEELQRWMDKHGIADIATDALTVFRPDSFRPSSNSIRIFNDGKSHVYKVFDPAIANAVNAMDRQQVSWMEQMLSKPASLLRLGSVYAPEFILRNPVRDQFSAWINSKHGYIPVYDMLRAAHEMVTGKAGHFQDWMLSGGANATLVGLDRKTIGLGGTTAMEKVGNVVKSPIEALKIASEFMENATRLGEFMRAKEKGKSSIEAALASREVTLDFARMGAKVHGLNMMIPFFNAQVEGVDRTARSIINNPVGTLTKIGMGITAPSIALWYANKDDPRIKEIERWEKDLFWLVATDKWVNMDAKDAAKVKDSLKRQIGDQWQRNDGTVYRIPKPFEVGIVFGSLVERMLDAYYKDNPRAFKDVGKTLAQGFLPSFIPTGVSPIIEHFSNRSIFMDRALVPKSIEDRKPEHQYTDRTSETAKFAGHLIAQVDPKSSYGSPIIIDNYIRGVTGGLGQYVVGAMDKILETSGATSDRGAKPAWSAADTPLLRAFVARFPSAGAESIQHFYDVWGDRKTSKAEMLMAQQAGNREELQRLRREDSALQAADPIHKRIGDLHKEIRETFNDKKMSAEAKRTKIDTTYLKMITEASRGVELIERRKAARVP